MSRTRNLIVFLLVSVLLCMASMVNNISSQDAHAEFYKVVQTITDILAGKNTQQALTLIHQGARLVYGARFENLKPVVAGEIKGLSLADSSYHGIMILGETNPSEDAGFITIKTVKSDTTQVRFHTVVFMKDSTGQFKIHSWHTGN
jgi:hypothetical protein